MRWVDGERVSSLKMELYACFEGLEISVCFVIGFRVKLPAFWASDEGWDAQTAQSTCVRDGRMSRWWGRHPVELGGLCCLNFQVVNWVLLTYVFISEHVLTDHLTPSFRSYGFSIDQSLESLPYPGISAF